MNAFKLSGAPGWVGAQMWCGKGSLKWTLRHEAGLEALVDFGAGVFAVWRTSDAKILARERVENISVRGFAVVLNNVLRDVKMLGHGSL